MGQQFVNCSPPALFSGDVDVITDYGERREEIIKCRSEAFETSHFGADRKLVQEIAAFARGGESPVNGWYGMEATRMALAAMQSIDEGGQTIRMSDLPDGPDFDRSREI